MNRRASGSGKQRIATALASETTAAAANEWRASERTRAWRRAPQFTPTAGCSESHIP